MKKLIILLLAFQQCISFGQNAPCVNDVSTDPNAPSNSNLPNDNHPDVEYDLLFLNHFNWVPFNQSGTLSDLQTTGGWVNGIG